MGRIDIVVAARHSQVTRGQELPENRPPKDWPWAENPPDIYFNYYVWANLYALNTCRQSRGLNQSVTLGPGEEGGRSPPDSSLISTLDSSTVFPFCPPAPRGWLDSD